MKVMKYQLSDKEQILKVSERLVDFELPERINREKFSQMQDQGMRGLLDDYLQEEDVTILTIKQGDEILGFIELTTENDWISKQKQGYISRIAVAKEAEGKGIGKMLMREAEAWAKQNGFSAIGLNVFFTNERAINFYKALGFELETVKMQKIL